MESFGQGMPALARSGSVGRLPALGPLPPSLLSSDTAQRMTAGGRYDDEGRLVGSEGATALSQPRSQGGVTEHELEEDLRRLIGLMEGAEEAVETAVRMRKDKRKKKKAKRKRVGPPCCSAAWWQATWKRPATLALCNNLFLIVVGFFVAVHLYEIDLHWGHLRVGALRAEGLLVHHERMDFRASGAGAALSLRSPAGSRTALELGRARVVASGQLTLAPGASAGTDAGRGFAGLEFGSADGGGDIQLLSTAGTIRHGAHVLLKDAIENLDAALVLQSSGDVGDIVLEVRVTG
jgi:hypothetical protein